MAGTPVKKPAAAGAKTAQKKSGIRTLKPGEVLFNNADPAESLYIIQKGQLRLYLPKGKGFVDLAILRAGEVLGEMAYFDEKSRRRSCSAAAIVTTEVIEISFGAFQKTIENLNPWFRTIITTLADRLRKTNDRVKELESNSVGFGVGGKVADYKFFTNQDVTRLLAMFYMTFKTHGQKTEDGKSKIHLNRIKFYMFDIFNIPEIKFEEFFHLLQTENIIEIGMDEENLPKLILIRDPEYFKNMLTFINAERLKEEAKQIKVGDRCVLFLSTALNYLAKHPPGPTKDSSGKPLMAYPGREFAEGEILLDVGQIVRIGEDMGLGLTDADIRDAVTAGLSDDVVVGDLNKRVAVINLARIKKIFPALKLMGALNKVNESKTSGAKYN